MCQAWGTQAVAEISLRPYIILGDQRVSTHLWFGNVILTQRSGESQNIATFWGEELGRDAQSLHLSLTMKKQHGRPTPNKPQVQQTWKDGNSHNSKVIHVLGNCANLYIYVFILNSI